MLGKKTSKFSVTNMKITKRRAPARTIAPNQVYISHKSHHSTTIQKIHTLLSTSTKDIYIHGLGSVCHKAIEIALEAIEKYPAWIAAVVPPNTSLLHYTVTTGTVCLLDDTESSDLDEPNATTLRNSSFICICIAPPSCRLNVGSLKDSKVPMEMEFMDHGIVL